MKVELEHLAFEKKNIININDNKKNEKHKQQAKTSTHGKASTFKKAMDKEKFEANEMGGEEESLGEKTVIDKQVEVHYSRFTFDKMSAQKETMLEKIITSKYFEYVILVILIINIAALATDRSTISTNELRNINKIDFAITWIFAVEILLRLMVFRPKNYFHNYFNIMDLVIILLNVGLIINNYIYDVDQFVSLYSSGSAIKCLKFLRIFRFLVGMVLWRRGAILFMEMIYSIFHIREFIAFCAIVMLIFAIIGRELFAYRVEFHVSEQENGSLEM